MNRDSRCLSACGVRVACLWLSGWTGLGHDPRKWFWGREMQASEMHVGIKM